MNNWQPSTLSWSFSRKTHLDSCRRFHFYHRFWGQDEKLKWLLVEMRNITTLMMLRGLVVHAVIARALNMIRLDETANAEIARAAALRPRISKSSCGRLGLPFSAPSQPIRVQWPGSYTAANQPRRHRDLCR